MSKHHNEFERFEHAGRTIILCYDEDAPSPRTERDGNLATLACWHRRENLGDEQVPRDLAPEIATSAEAFTKYVEERTGDKVLAIVPIWIYQHSGISLMAHPTRPGYPFNCKWDAGQVGWAYVLKSSADKAECEPGKSWKTSEGETITYDQARYEYEIAQEVALYTRWLNGSFAGYIVEDEDGDVLDSCWGFDDPDYCREEAKSAAESARSPGQVDSTCNASCND